MIYPNFPKWAKKWFMFWVHFFKMLALAAIFVLMCGVVGGLVGIVIFYMASWVGFSQEWARLMGGVFGLTAMILTGVWILG